MIAYAKSKSVLEAHLKLHMIFLYTLRYIVFLATSVYRTENNDTSS